MRRGVEDLGSRGTVAPHRRVRSSLRPLVLLAFIVLLFSDSVQAQTSSLAEQLRMQRVQVRAQEIVATMGLATEPRLPVEVPTAPSVAMERMFWWLPPSRTPRVNLAPLVAVPEPEPEPEPEPLVLDEIEWDRVGAQEQGDFLDRFGEALWSVDGMHRHTPLDTLATPEIRARLFGHFGAPTRTAVARGVEGFEGSIHVQFEYWFVVNDSIPFVALDVDGPFGQGLVLAGDYADAAVLGQLKSDFSERLLREQRLMPYVDYYFSRDRDQWYRTGFDGADYYTEEVDRPRWARRRSDDTGWYLLR